MASIVPKGAVFIAVHPFHEFLSHFTGNDSLDIESGSSLAELARAHMGHWKLGEKKFQATYSKSYPGPYPKRYESGPCFYTFLYGLELLKRIKKKGYPCLWIDGEEQAEEIFNTRKQKVLELIGTGKMHRQNSGWFDLFQLDLMGDEKRIFRDKLYKGFRERVEEFRGTGAKVYLFGETMSVCIKVVYGYLEKKGFGPKVIPHATLALHKGFAGKFSPEHNFLFRLFSATALEFYHREVERACPEFSFAPDEELKALVGVIPSRLKALIRLAGL